jgi:hypothetical protein
MDGEQDRISSGPGRFRPGPQPETEKPPVIAQGFRLLWALSFAQIEYRAHYRQVGDVL